MLKVSRKTATSKQAPYAVTTDLGRLLQSRHWSSRLKLFSPNAAKNMLLGNVRSRFRGRGMEFEEVRRYQAGDDIRAIDWKVTARVGQTFTKLFCEERERPCHIIVDQRSSLYFGSTTQFKSVLAAETGAALAWAALAGGDRVGGQVISDYSESDSRAKRSKQAVLKLIHDIHESNAGLTSGLDLGLDFNSNSNNSQTKTDLPTRSSLAVSLEECSRITRPGTAIFIISDFHDFDSAAAKALSNLGRHSDLSLFNVYDPLEKKLPAIGNVTISDGQKKTRLNISNKLASAYQHEVAERELALKAAVTRARAMYVEMNTAHSARSSLIKLFSS